MSEDLYQRAKKLFLEASGLPPGEQGAFLDRECADDAALRAEVESLLKHSAPTNVVGSTPALGTSAPREVATDQRIGSYRIIREIGRGGMGVVYLAVREDDQFKRRVAIKVLKRGMDTEDVLRRFDTERQVLAAMNHPGIARLYDAGETEEGTPYFVMEYVEGTAIDKYCDVHRLRIDERLDLFMKVCSAVHYAHQNLIVHRDLKPSNVVVTQDGQPKLLDFGIAKLINPDLSLVVGDPTAPEIRLMTPEYASPEQVRGDPITTASDVYSLGVLLYELLSGHRPYRLRSRVRAEIERVICDEEPEKPSTAISRIEQADSDDRTTTGAASPESVSKTREGRLDRLRRRLAGDIDNIVLMALRKEAQRRYASAEQLAEDLRRHLDGLPVKARRDTVGYRMAKFVRRNRVGVAAGIAIVLALSTAVVGTSWGMVEAKAGRREAEDARAAEETQRRIAESERDRADRRFEQVRDLARTFMFDFHDQIEQLDGALPARRLLVTTALEYLDALAQEVENRPELERELAFAYDRVGDIRGGIRDESEGDIEGALGHYRTALSIREALAPVSPDDLSLQNEIASSHIRIGDMLKETGNVSEALLSYREALEVRERLAREKPSPETRRDLAVVLADIGARLTALGDCDGAIEHYQRSRQLRLELAEEAPGDEQAQRDLSLINLYLAAALERVGRNEEALESYRAVLETRRALAEANEDDSRRRRDLAVAHSFVGRVCLTLEQWDGAEEHLNRYFQITAQRAAANPASDNAKRDLAIAHELVGRMHRMRGDLEAAKGSFQECLSLSEQLVEAHPTSVICRHMKACGLEGISGVLGEQEQLDPAIEHAEEALRIRKDLVTADQEDVRWQEAHAYCLSLLASLYADGGRVLPAYRSFEEAVGVWETLPAGECSPRARQEGLISALHELSRLAANLEQGPEALAYAQRAESLVSEPDAALLRDLGVAYHMVGESEQAVEAAQRALASLDDRPESDDDLRRLLEEDLERYRK